MFKKVIGVLLSVSMLAVALTGCTSAPAEPAAPAEQEAAPAAEPAAPAEEAPAEEAAPAGPSGTVKVAALDAAYGTGLMTDIAAGFMEMYPDVTVELIIDKSLEEVIGPSMLAGDYPDVVYVSTGRPMALTETFIKDNGLEDLTDLLSMNVAGESVTVQDKIIGGFLDTVATNPYPDGKTYLVPDFYDPCGLWYDAGLFEAKGWSVPTTWDEMWALGDLAKEEGISLFTYPTAGYYDAFFFSLLYEAGGPEFFQRAMNYEEGIWETPEATAAFDIVVKLASYTHPTVPSNANQDNFLKNQQLILDDQALFMPNGTWITGEMADAPRAEGFKWGFTALPAIKAGGDRYSFAWFGQAWIPAGAENKDLAKLWFTYFYSDKAAEIAANYNAPLAIKGASDFLTDEEKKMFFSIYDNGAKVALGNWGTTEAVEGIGNREIWFDPVDSLVSGDKTREEYLAAIIDASDKLRAALITE